MCKKIRYDGMEIDPFTSEEPVTFGPHGVERSSPPLLMFNEGFRKGN
jgi:hypothetical protein